MAADASKKHDIRGLRAHLFETLEMLKDKEKPLELDRAKAICEVAQVIVNTAKVEVSAMKEVGGLGTEFLNIERNEEDRRLPEPKSKPGLSTGKNIGGDQ